MGRRLQYTEDEDDAIIGYIEKIVGSETHEVKLCGNVFWKKAQRLKVTSHPWQSMRHRYLNILQFKIDLKCGQLFSHVHNVHETKKEEKVTVSSASTPICRPRLRHVGGKFKLFCPEQNRYSPIDTVSSSSGTANTKSPCLKICASDNKEAEPVNNCSNKAANMESSSDTDDSFDHRLLLQASTEKIEHSEAFTERAAREESKESMLEGHEECGKSQNVTLERTQPITEQLLLDLTKCLTSESGQSKKPLYERLVKHLKRCADNPHQTNNTKVDLIPIAPDVSRSQDETVKLMMSYMGSRPAEQKISISASAAEVQRKGSVENLKICARSVRT